MLWTLVGIVLLIVFTPIALAVMWELRWVLFWIAAALASVLWYALEGS